MEENVQFDTMSTEADGNNKAKRVSFLSNRGILVVFSSDFIGKAFVVDKVDMIIGRSERADIVLQAPLISKEHCRITIDDNFKFHIEDLHSTNATFVNGKEIKKVTALNYGDKIVIGETVLRFFIEENTLKK